MKIIEKIVDIQTGEETILEREMTEVEKNQFDADEAAAKIAQAEFKAKSEAKAAILEKLGITEDEAKILLS